MSVGVLKRYEQLKKEKTEKEAVFKITKKEKEKEKKNTGFCDDI